MDAYDIFKKLTKGLTFKHNVLGINNKLKPKPNKQETEVKFDGGYTEDVKVKEEIPKESDVSPSHSECEDASDADLQLLEGVKTGKKKKKKEKPEDLAKKLELEEQNRFRNEHGIKAVGRHIPSALKNFSELVTRYNVSQALVDILNECGYEEPTPVQRQVLPCMLENRQIFACAPTGSGKTAAFLLPLVHALGAPQGGPRALVLCPTRELAHQIYGEALRLTASTKLRCSIVRSIKESKVKEREATIKKSDIVISTPNRLCYLLNREDVNISLDKIEWLVIDEADKLFEGSEDEASAFRTQLSAVVAACPARRRVVALSATHTPAVAKWCRHNMRGVINVTVGLRNGASELVQQELLFCGNEAGKLLAFRQLLQQGIQPPILVFVQSKDRAKQLFKELIYDGINVDVIHADRTQAQRDNVVRSFRVGRVWVLICTELMGRGMDFRGVSLVINYDFPPSAIAYVHRIGRAGRAGQTGRAITFFTQDDVANLRSIASVLRQSGCSVPDYMLQLKLNRNERRRREARAPRRDQIATVLQKRPDKRKLEGEDKAKELEKKDTEIVKNAKNKKLRKIKNGEVKKGKSKEEKKHKGKENKKNNKKMGKTDKTNNKKRKKKAFAKPKVST